MQVRIWISYDLGVKGDYPGMYAWLDNHKAVECGDSFASLYVECTNRGTVVEDVLAEIKENVNLAPSDRIYVIYRREDNMTRGTFIHGRRKANPWEGYGHRDGEIEESDE